MRLKQVGCARRSMTLSPCVIAELLVIATCLSFRLSWDILTILLSFFFFSTFAVVPTQLAEHTLQGLLCESSELV